MDGARSCLRHLLLLSVLVMSAAASSESLDKDLLTALRSGGYVILMRHASSPPVPPAPGQANPDNVEHERQLDDRGRAAARGMGDALRRLRIPIGLVLSSPTYRALETVRLARLGKSETHPELGDAGHSMQADASGQRGAWIRKRVAAPPPHGTNTLIVTQLPNIVEAFPEEAQGLGEGGALIFRPDGAGKPALVARVKMEEWSSWAALFARREVDGAAAP